MSSVGDVFQASQSAVPTRAGSTSRPFPPECPESLPIGLSARDCMTAICVDDSVTTRTLHFDQVLAFRRLAGRCVVAMSAGHVSEQDRTAIGRRRRADSYKASTMRTSCSPSSPDGSGWVSFKMQSEKYSSSGANWSRFPTLFARVFPSIVRVYSSPSAYSYAGSAWRCPFVPTIRYAATSEALKLVTKVANRSSPNRSVAAVVSSISARLFRPLLMDTADTSVGSARNRFRAALMQYTPMSYSVPPPYARLVRMSPRRTVIENDDVKNFNSPSSPRRASSMAEIFSVFEMQTIRDHELDAARPARGDHLLALLDGDGHRFFAQDVDARLCRPDGVFRVHRVRQRDIHRVDFVQTVFELFVGEGVIEAVAPGDLSPLGPIIADDGHQLRVASRMCERRQHRHLRDVSEPDDAVAYLRARWHDLSSAKTLFKGGLAELGQRLPLMIRAAAHAERDGQRRVWPVPREGGRADEIARQAPSEA